MYEIDEWKTTKRWVWRILFFSFGVIIAGLILYGLGFTVLTPGTLLVKTLDADKIIHNYEWFQETYSGIKATKVNINNTLTSLEDKTITKRFRERQQIHLYGLNNYLQDMIADYNAKSRMITRKYWKSGNLPYQIKYGGSFKERIEYEYIQ